MAYFKDLDEYTHAELLNELLRRKTKRMAGACDYCNRPIACEPNCKFVERHFGFEEINVGPMLKPNNLPTQPGWYWLQRKFPEFRDECVRVMEVGNKPRGVSRLQVLLNGNGDVQDINAYAGHLWSDPLMLPEVK